MPPNIVYNPYHPANYEIIKNTAIPQPGVNAVLAEALNAVKAKFPGAVSGYLPDWAILVYPENGIIFLAMSAGRTALRLPQTEREHALQVGATTSFPVKGWMTDENQLRHWGEGNVELGKDWVIFGGQTKELVSAVAAYVSH